MKMVIFQEQIESLLIASEPGVTHSSPGYGREVSLLKAESVMVER